jgi:hypothetical protein
MTTEPSTQTGSADEGRRAPDAGGEDRRRLRRDIGRVSLLFISLGSIIGSGWLLAAPS